MPHSPRRPHRHPPLLPNQLLLSFRAAAYTSLGIFQADILSTFLVDGRLLLSVLFLAPDDLEFVSLRVCDSSGWLDFHYPASSFNWDLCQVNTFGTLSISDVPNPSSFLFNPLTNSTNIILRKHSVISTELSLRTGNEDQRPKNQPNTDQPHTDQANPPPSIP